MSTLAKWPPRPPLPPLVTGEVYMLGTTADDAPRLNTLLAGGSVHLVVTGEGTIGAPLLLHDDTTLELRQATITLADGVDDCMVRNADLAAGNTNVRVIGDGVFDANGANQSNGQGVGTQLATLWKNCSYLFSRVTNLLWDGPTIKDYPQWGMSPQNCVNWKLVNFHSQLTFENTRQSPINTADGNLDGLIANVTGDSYDDFVAIVARQSVVGAPTYAYDGGGGVCRGVKISNVVGDCHEFEMLRLLTGDGSEMHDVEWDGLQSTRASGVDANALVTIGTDAYIIAPPAAAQFTGLRGRGMKGGAAGATTGYVIRVGQDVNDLSIEDLDVVHPWRQVLHVDSGVTINELDLLSCRVLSDPAAGTGTVIRNQGTIGRLLVRARGKTAKHVFDNTGATINNADVDTNFETCTDLYITDEGTVGNKTFKLGLAGTKYIRTGKSTRFAKQNRVSGNLTLNSTVWAEVAAATGGPGTGGFDLTIDGAIKDGWIEAALSALWGSEAVTACLDVVIVHGDGSLGRMISDALAPDNAKTGVPAWRSSSTAASQVGYPAPYVVQASDLIVAFTGDTIGQLKLRPMYRTTTAANKTLNCAAAAPFIQWARALA